MSDFEAPPAELERAAQTRLAVQTHSLLLPVLKKARRDALRRAFSLLDRGEALEPVAALGAVLELYAIEKLERVLRQAIRRGKPVGTDGIPSLVQEEAGRS